MLREQVSACTAFWLAMVIIGAVLVRPWRLGLYHRKIAIGVMSAVFAIDLLSVNKLSKRHHSYEIVFYFLFIATLIAAAADAERVRLAQRLSVRHSARHRPGVAVRAGRFNPGPSLPIT